MKASSKDAIASMSAMYIVQSYQPGKRGAERTTPVVARDVVHAKRLAERLASRSTWSLLSYERAMQLMETSKIRS